MAQIQLLDVGYQSDWGASYFIIYGEREENPGNGFILFPMYKANYKLSAWTALDRVLFTDMSSVLEGISILHENPTPQAVEHLGELYQTSWDPVHERLISDISPSHHDLFGGDKFGHLSIGYVYEQPFRARNAPEFYRDDDPRTLYSVQVYGFAGVDGTFVVDEQLTDLRFWEWLTIGKGQKGGSEHAWMQDKAWETTPGYPDYMYRSGLGIYSGPYGTLYPDLNWINDAPWNR